MNKKKKPYDCAKPKFKWQNELKIFSSSRENIKIRRWNVGRRRFETKNQRCVEEACMASYIDELWLDRNIFFVNDWNLWRTEIKKLT